MPRSFQIIKPQRVMETLRLRVGYSGAPNLAGLADRVEAEILTRLGVPVQVEFVTMTSC